MQKPRVDLYGPIHQGIRRMLYETALDIGTTDFRSDDAMERTLTALEHALGMLTEHAGIEDETFHPALEERAPGACATQEAQHEHLEATHEELEALIEQMRDASGMARVGIGMRLYSMFNDYVADQIQHMAGEEEQLKPLFWEHFSDEELEAMRGSVMRKFSPDRMAEWWGWMLPSLNQVQLVGMLSGMRAAMPAAAFEGVTGNVSAILGERWPAVASELG